MSHLLLSLLMSVLRSYCHKARRGERSLGHILGDGEQDMSADEDEDEEENDDDDKDEDGVESDGVTGKREKNVTHPSQCSSAGHAKTSSSISKLGATDVKKKVAPTLSDSPESEDQDPFDFSASLAKGRLILSSAAEKKKRKKREEREKEKKKKSGTSYGEFQEEEEEEEEGEEEEEEEEEEVEEEKEDEGEDMKKNRMGSAEGDTSFDGKCSLGKNISDGHSYAPSIPTDNLPESTATGMEKRPEEVVKEVVSEGVSACQKSNKRTCATKDVRDIVLNVGMRTRGQKRLSATLIEKKSNNDIVASGPIISGDSIEPLSADVHSDWSDERKFHRCLIFAQHRQTLDIVEECVMKKHFPSVTYRRLDGTVAPMVRAEVAHRFNNQDKEKGKDRDRSKDNDRDRDKAGGKSGPPEEDVRILLMTARSCGLGLNLTAADTVIL